uniref:hypothetical protein n=1 Tax=Escherichia coli TaxID=562 RepID=UPI001BDBCAA2
KGREGLVLSFTTVDGHRLISPRLGYSFSQVYREYSLEEVLCYSFAFALVIFKLNINSRTNARVKKYLKKK